MKETGCGLEIFLTSGHRKGHIKENENDIRLKKKLFSHKTLTSYEKLLLECW